MSVALSGNTMEQVTENVASACNSDPCEMTEKELELINRVKQNAKNWVSTDAKIVATACHAPRA